MQQHMYTLRRSAFGALRLRSPVMGALRGARHAVWRRAALSALGAAAFVGAYALGAALDARDAATCPTITAEVQP